MSATRLARLACAGLALSLVTACSHGHEANPGEPDAAPPSPPDAAVPVSFGTGGTWALDEARGATASGDPLRGAPAWTVGKVGTALHLDGHADAIETAQPALDGSHSFSASAWVQLDRVDAAGTVLALTGRHTSGFALDFVPAAGATPGGFGASFAAADDDSAGAAAIRIAAPFAPVADVWYHVAAVYDAGAHVARLYVDGRKVAEGAVAATVAAPGPTTIGRGMIAGAPARYWPGTLDEVHLAAVAWSDGDVASQDAAAPTITPVRPPAVPLIVRSPYVSVWMPADVAPGHWPTFWTGAVKAITGLVRVDGTPYVFLGAPTGGAALAQQVQLEITATQSRYELAAGGVRLYVTFVSPVEAGDLRRLSMPFGYVTVQAVSIDGQAHATSVYLDISGEWAHGDAATPVVWSRADLAAQPNLSVFAVTPQSPGNLAEAGDYASWGTGVLAAASADVHFQAGADADVRGQFLTGGTLTNTVDTGQPRKINDRWPVFAYQADLGAVAGAPSRARVFALGNARQPAASYLGAPVAPLWQAYWPTWQAMLADGFADASAGTLIARADALDRKIAPAAVAAGGAHYAALCALALRQAFAGTELIGTAGDPWLLLKEISSDGNVQTVDVIYPSMPAFLYADPTLVRLMLTPLFEYAESGHWPQPFAPHDLGSSYPNASAHNDGGGENMPVEESANMVLMTAAYLRAAPGAESTAFATAHYATLKQWAEYLVVNAPDPGFQNQTDDFTGFIAHSSNLALKGLLAIGAMGQIAHTLGKTVDAAHYTQVAKDDLAAWATQSQDGATTHLKLAYDGPDDTWSLKYSYPDRLLGLGLIPPATLAEESAWYAAQRAEYGFPLDNRHAYTKGDWELWTAAGVSDPALRQAFVDTVYHFADRTPQRVPMTDWYDTQSGAQQGFQARPVAGGLFSLLTLAE